MHNIRDDDEMMHLDGKDYQQWLRTENVTSTADFGILAWKQQEVCNINKGKIN